MDCDVKNYDDIIKELECLKSVNIKLRKKILSVVFKYYSDNRICVKLENKLIFFKYYSIIFTFISMASIIYILFIKMCTL